MQGSSTLFRLKDYPVLQKGEPKEWECIQATGVGPFVNAEQGPSGTWGTATPVRVVSRARGGEERSAAYFYNEACLEWTHNASDLATLPYSPCYSSLFTLLTVPCSPCYNPLLILLHPHAHHATLLGLLT